ncbi:MAG TPA: hypothetical protein VF155_09565 [Candidatus Dormibacteraeota bacterium]
MTDQTNGSPENAAAGALGPSASSIARRLGVGEHLVQPTGAELPPIVENAGLPVMSMTIQRQLISGQQLEMVAHPAAAATSGLVMAEFVRSQAEERIPQSYQPQQARPGVVTMVSKESYVRIQVRVSNGNPKVIGISEVPGPLGPPEPVFGGLAYEVTLGNKRIGFGSIPDPVWRSFPPETPTKGMEGHHFSEASDYEFTARVPRAELSAAALPELQIGVYRHDGTQVVQPTGDVPVAREFGNVLTSVARLQGVHIDQLEAPVRSEVQRIVSA